MWKIISLDTSAGFSSVIQGINRCCQLSDLGFSFHVVDDPDASYYSRGELRLEIQEIQRMGPDLWKTFISFL